MTWQKTWITAAIGAALILLTIGGVAVSLKPQAYSQMSGTQPSHGIQGPAGPTGATGPAGITCYNASGAVAACKLWFGTATVDASGNWSVSYAGAGFTAAPNVQITSVNTVNGGVLIPKTQTSTATGASGNVQGLSVVLGLLTLGLTSINGSTISVQAIGG